MKEATGIAGLDSILGGGLPTGRASLVVGGPGCGKTLLATQFVIEGARRGQAGIYVSFEQQSATVRSDLATLHPDIDELMDRDLLLFAHVDLDAAGDTEAGPYSLEGLRIQLGALMKKAGNPRRMALDTLESLFTHIPDHRALRRELHAMFRWLCEQGVTVLATAERGEDSVAQHSLEEFISDCVILLDYRVEQRIATRRARVLKMRGSGHDGDEHPFIIDGSGFKLFPLTVSQLEHVAPEERIPTGVDGLDEMLGGLGYFRGSSILVSGTAGSGKSTLAASFVEEACSRGETALYLAFEESPHQIVRNMRSVGIDLKRWIDKGNLKIVARRPSEIGLEGHLHEAQRAVLQYTPDVTVIDPLTSLRSVSSAGTARSMMVRLVSLLKERLVTTIYTSLGAISPSAGDDESGLISSLMDTWVVLQSKRIQGHRRRFLWVLKSRGMEHSNEMREIVVSDGRIAATPITSGEADIGISE